MRGLQVLVYEALRCVRPQATHTLVTTLALREGLDDVELAVFVASNT